MSAKIHKLLTDTKERWVILPLLLLNFVLITFHFETWTSTRVSVRPIAEEERAVLSATLQRLQGRGSQVQNFVSHLKTKLKASQMMVANTGNTDLVEEWESQFVFEESFFNSDSITQEASLLHLSIAH